MKITISKSQWELLKTNTLCKISSKQINNKLYIKISSTQWNNIKLAAFISHNEFIRRMMEIGWDMSPARLNHYTIKSPDGGFQILMNGHHSNWEAEWRKPKQNFMTARSEATKKVKQEDGTIIEVPRYKDPHLLDFIFKHPFEIPPNFNKKTQEIDIPKQIKNIPIEDIPIENMNIFQIQQKNLIELKNEHKISEWVTVNQVDTENNQILTEDGRIMNVDNPQRIRSKKI